MHCAPYQARTNAREFEKSENGKMLAMKVIEPGETELATPIVFATRNESSHRFLLTIKV